MCHASLRRQKEVAGMEQINVAMIPAVLAGIVKQLEAIDGWLTLKDRTGVKRLHRPAGGLD